MKHLVLTALALMCMNAAAFAAGPDTFECVRPDGTVVCTVRAPSGDPSVTCNHDCVDCNMTCTARQIVVREGNELIVNPGAPSPVPSKPEGRGGVGVETPQYCQQQYQQCVSRCRSNPNNRTQFDMNACTAACDSAKSGCGTKPTPY
jgi:hypothetical protein